MKKIIIINIIFTVILSVLLLFCSCFYGVETVCISISHYDDNDDFYWGVEDTTLYKWMDKDSDISITDSYIWNGNEYYSNYKSMIYSLPNNFVIINYQNKNSPTMNTEMKYHAKDELYI